MRIARFAVVLAMLFSPSGSIARSMPELTVFPSTGVENIEPALDDYVTFQWKAPQSSSSPVSVVILMQDAKGTVKDAATSTAYRQVGEAAFGADQQLARWPAKGQAAAEIPAARLRVGVKWADEHIEMSDSYVTVSPTLSQISSTGSSYSGDDDQGKTSISYFLSTGVRKCTIMVAGARIAGTTKAGENELKDAWDGVGGDGRMPHAEVCAITGVTEPPAGPQLKISDVSLWKIKDNDRLPAKQASFDPSRGEKLELRFRLSEPVKRLQATEARAWAEACSEGSTVKIIADEQKIEIDNDPGDGIEQGWNSIIWDGTDEAKETVSGVYTLTLCASDNAGIGCEAGLTMVDVAALDTRVIPETIEFCQTNAPGALVVQVPPGASVSWSHAVSGKIVATGVNKADKNGCFEIKFKETWGTHVFSAVAKRQGQPDVKGETELFFNRFTSLSGETRRAGSMDGVFYARNRFCPDKGQTLQIKFRSEVADVIECRVERSSVYCVWPDPSNRVPAALYLEGWSSLISGGLDERVIWEKHRIEKGENAVVWDGRDSKGQLVPTGVYWIDTYHIPYIGFKTIAIVDRTNDSDLITAISTKINGNIATVSWKTARPTVGALLTNEIGITKPIVEPSVSHTQQLPVEPGTRIHFWIVADDGKGNMQLSSARVISISSRQKLTKRIAQRTKQSAAEKGLPECEHVGGAFATSKTTAVVAWRSEGAAYGSVRYARVGETLAGLQWKSARETKATKEHSIQLISLSPNSEYVYQIQSASSAARKDMVSWEYGCFCTDVTKPSVKIVSPEADSIVSGPFDVVVEASDEIHRYSDNGISSLKLEVDGEELRGERQSGSNNYVFHVDGDKLRAGFHLLEARGTDDYWNTANRTAEILVKKQKTVPSNNGPAK